MGASTATTRKKKKTRKPRNTNRQPLFPPAVHEFLARRVTDSGATVLCGVGAFLLVALAGYDAGDPSLNTAAVTDAVRNYLGAPGAYTADFLLQSLGLAAVLPCIALLVWGTRIFMRMPVIRPLPALCLLLSSVLFVATALARLPAFESWTLAPYLGGSLGALSFNAVAGALQGVMGNTAHVFVALSGAIMGVLCFALSLGIRPEGWKKAGHAVAAATAIAIGKTRETVYRLRRWHSAHSAIEENPARTASTSTPRIMDAKPTAPTSVKKPVVSDRPARPAQGSRASAEKQPSLLPSVDGEWQLPTLDLLDEPPKGAAEMLDARSLQTNAELLQNVLNDFGVKGEVIQVNPGPIVTLYELEPAPGTKSARVIGLSDDIARSMSADSARIAVVPGKNAIGIELPNQKRETVFLRELLESSAYERSNAKLPLVLGKDIGGRPIIADLAKMPHLLVAGTTGSGKSVAVNTMILSLLYRLSPDRCRLIMIDPKMLELSVYDDIPHLMTPVVTEPNKAITSLKWAVREMEDRYRAMSRLGVRNIEGYNMRIRTAVEKGETLVHKVQTGFDAETGKPVYEEQPIPPQELPYIVIVVDEFADLMLVAGKEVENAIQRLAQMARAAGIHLIMATQRPSVDVITGVVKANFPTRISFQVTSKIDSRTILGEGGAEQLLGNGDMLYMATGGRIQRVHGPFVDTYEVEHVVDFLRGQGDPEYIDGVTEGGDDDGDDIRGIAAGSGEQDELYDHAVALVIREQKASTSFVQRHLQIGYNRAARMIEQMEKQGIIGPANHVGKREILIEETGV